jgi:hypothetical protein
MNKIFLSESTQESNIGIDGISEENRMTKLCDSIHNYSATKNLIKRNSESDTLQSTIDKSNNFNSDYHLALHSNSCGKYHKNYNEASTDIYYHFKSQNGKKMAEKLKTIFNEYMPYRKIIIRPDSYLYNTGLAELRKTKAAAILVENFWHCNGQDIEFYYNNMQVFKQVYYRFVWILINKEI